MSQLLPIFETNGWRVSQQGMSISDGEVHRIARFQVVSAVCLIHWSCKTECIEPCAKFSNKDVVLSDRFYGQYTELDKYVLDKLTTPEDKYQRITEAKRAYLRPLVMAKYKELAKKQNVELSEKTLKKKASEYLEVQGLTKGNGTYEDLYKSDKWNTIREEIKTIEE